MHSKIERNRDYSDLRLMSHSQTHSLNDRSAGLSAFWAVSRSLIRSIYTPIHMAVNEMSSELHQRSVLGELA